VLEFAQIDANSSRYRDLVEFRRRILRRPLGLDFTPEQLAEEQADIHIAAYLDCELVGCVVLTAVDGSQIADRILRLLRDVILAGPCSRR
jgi:hypothetical protein